MLVFNILCFYDCFLLKKEKPHAPRPPSAQDKTLTSDRYLKLDKIWLLPISRSKSSGNQTADSIIKDGSRFRGVAWGALRARRHPSFIHQEQGGHYDGY